MLFWIMLVRAMIQIHIQLIVFLAFFCVELIAISPLVPFHFFIGESELMMNILFLILETIPYIGSRQGNNMNRIKDNQHHTYPDTLIMFLFGHQGGNRAAMPYWSCWKGTT